MKRLRYATQWMRAVATAAFLAVPGSLAAQATGQITRSANDGIQAYRRVSQALAAEASHVDSDPEEIERTTRDLAEARAGMLAALDVASKRYPWAEPWEPSTGA